MNSFAEKEMKTKNLLILNASPRKKGNIAQMVETMSNEAMEHGADKSADTQAVHCRCDTRDKTRL